MYVCMYVCIYRERKRDRYAPPLSVCLSVYLSIYLSTYTYIQTDIYVCMYVCMYVCICGEIERSARQRHCQSSLIFCLRTCATRGLKEAVGHLRRPCSSVSIRQHTSAYAFKRQWGTCGGHEQLDGFKQTVVGVVAAEMGSVSICAFVPVLYQFCASKVSKVSTCTAPRRPQRFCTNKASTFVSVKQVK